VIASASEANQDYLREIGAIPVLYGEGVAGRVRAAAGDRVDAVFDIAGKTPVQELVSLVSEPSQVVSIANFAAGQAGARVTGGEADSRPMEALAEAAELLAQNRLVIKVQTFPFDRAADATASVKAVTSAESSSWSDDRAAAAERFDPSGSVDLGSASRA
jgi:NADPH:quinone reductase-like Zn-dependent oxidoreductase